MTIRLRSSMLRTAITRAALCLAPAIALSTCLDVRAEEQGGERRIVAGSELAQAQPPAVPTQTPAVPAVPRTNPAPTNVTQPPVAPGATTQGPQPPTNPNPQVGPNAVAQAQPNLAVRAPAPNRNFSMARVPNMIGDLPGGGGAQIQTTGIFASTLAHPNLIHGRLNVAENNSPVIGDRCYFTYRHFEAASSLDYNVGVPGGVSASQNIDRVMFGIERQLTDTNSLELRLPFNGQLDSNLLATQFAGNQTNIPTGQTNFELGNINLIFKQALIDADDFYLSGGLGLNLPTAPDVKYRTRIVDPAYVFFDFSRVPPTLLGTAALNLDQQIAVRNQTVNLSPYLSAAYRPTERTFVQGFLQWDVPLNKSSVSVDEFFTAGTGPTSRGSFRGDLEQQVLMRANVGFGRWWCYRDGSRFFHSLATMFEVHYTTALEDADLAGPFRLNSNVPQVFTQTTVGNLANRIDVVNLTAGVPMIVGRTTFTHAFTLPIRGELNRAFDLEYSLLIDRRF
jgi:hypothetical protein